MNEALLLACYCISFILFWLPARFFVRQLQQEVPMREVFVDLFTLVIACVIGYTAFWVYLLRPSFGVLFATTHICCGLLVALSGWRSIGDNFSVPVRVAFLIGLLYLSALSLFGGVGKTPTWFIPEADEDLAQGYFSLMPRSIDSLISLKFACAIANAGPLLLDINFGDWHFSDRPPLQTGVILLFWPLTRFFTIGVVGQAVGTLLQIQWVVAIAAIAQTLGLRPRQLRFAVIMIAGAGFVYFNSVYVWPKFLAAALVFAAATPLVLAWRERISLDGAGTILAASASALAMLAHGSAAFSLIPLALLALGYRRLLCWRIFVPGCLVTLLLYLPWMAYQKYVDPPGDRCVKWMLAGQTAVNLQPWPKAVMEAYAKETPGSLFRSRWRSFLNLFGDSALDHNIAKSLRGFFYPALRPRDKFVGRYYLEPEQLDFDLPTLAALIRYDQVEQTFRALGLLNLAWPLLLFRAAYSRGRYLRQPGLTILAAFAVLNVIVWLALMFQDYGILIRNASYALLLALYLLATLVIYDTSPIFRWTIGSMHLFCNFVVWVVYAPTKFAVAHYHLAASPQFAPLAGAFLALAGLVYCLIPRKMPMVSGPVMAQEPGPATGLVKQLTGFLAVGGTCGLAFILAIAPPVALYRHALPVSLNQAQGNENGRQLWRAGILTVAGICVPERLFDGVTNDPLNFACAGLNAPVNIQINPAQPLHELRLHLYDFDDRAFNFTVEGQYAGQWSMLLDRSKEMDSGCVVIPLADRPLSAIRIIGLYNSDQRHNPINKAILIKELELAN